MARRKRSPWRAVAHKCLATRAQHPPSDGEPSRWAVGVEGSTGARTHQRHRSGTAEVDSSCSRAVRSFQLKSGMLSSTLILRTETRSKDSRSAGGTWSGRRFRFLARPSTPQTCDIASRLILCLEPHNPTANLARRPIIWATSPASEPSRNLNPALSCAGCAGALAAASCGHVRRGGHAGSGGRAPQVSAVPRRARCEPAALRRCCFARREEMPPLCAVPRRTPCVEV